MVDIQSKEVIDKISDELKIQPSLQIPRELAKAIQLVYNVNPVRDVKLANATAIDSDSVTIHTTHATKRTFIIGYTLSVTKDVVNDSIESHLDMNPISQGVTGFAFINYEPTTAGSFVISGEFHEPIELKKGTNIRVRNGAATASIDAAGSIYFFETDPQ